MSLDGNLLKVMICLFSTNDNNNYERSSERFAASFVVMVGTNRKKYKYF